MLCGICTAPSAILARETEQSHRGSVRKRWAKSDPPHEKQDKEQLRLHLELEVLTPPGQSLQRKGKELEGPTESKSRAAALTTCVTSSEGRLS